MTSEIIIEKLDNGITIQWSDIARKYDIVRKVALDGSEPEGIGKEVWKDILDVLTKETTQKVQVTLEYKAI